VKITFRQWPDADLQQGSLCHRFSGHDRHQASADPQRPELWGPGRYFANAASIAFLVLMVSLLASNSTSLQRTLVDLDLIDLMPNVTSSLARRALLRHGFLSIHARLHVGIRGKS
jgi:hypothetical protein